jgi:hypothetical protein
MVMLFNNATAVLRQRVKLYDDCVTRQHIARYYDWHMANNPDPAIKGDFEVDARGSTALIERDIQNQALLNLARNAANAGEKAGVVSLDMKEKDALLRIHQALVDKSEIPAEDWRPDRWRPAYEARLRDGLVRWRKSITGDLGIYAVPVGDLSWVSASITKGIEAGVTFFVIDHLQKIRVQGVNGPADRAELISETLDNFCDEFGVTIVGLSQLNREASRDRDRKPIMQDLLGGTSLESNAQVVIMLDHSRYERDETRHHIGRTWVMLDKNQMGPKNFEVAVEVNHATLEYREALPDEMRDWPGAIDDAPRRRR